MYYSICIAECLNIYTQGYYRNHILNVYAVSFNGLHEETVVVQLVAIYIRKHYAILRKHPDSGDEHSRNCKITRQRSRDNKGDADTLIT